MRMLWCNRRASRSPSIDPALAIHGVTTMAQVVSDASAPQRFSATLLTAFAIGAMALAGIGLYGILAFGVAQRTREIGVRLALGANRGEVIGMVVSQGMRLTAIGLVLGGLAALGAARLLQSLLFETDSFDPWTFAIVPLALACGFARRFVSARSPGCECRSAYCTEKRIGD